MKGINRSQYENLLASLSEVELLLQEKIDGGDNHDHRMNESLNKAKINRDKLKRIYTKYQALLEKLEETIDAYNDLHLEVRNHYLKQLLKEIKGEMKTKSEKYSHYQESVSLFYST